MSDYFEGKTNKWVVDSLELEFSKLNESAKQPVVYISHSFKARNDSEALGVDAIGCAEYLEHLLDGVSWLCMLADECEDHATRNGGETLMAKCYNALDNI